MSQYAVDSFFNRTGNSRTKLRRVQVGHVHGHEGKILLIKKKEAKSSLVCRQLLRVRDEDKRAPNQHMHVGSKKRKYIYIVLGVANIFI